MTAMSVYTRPRMAALSMADAEYRAELNRLASAAIDAIADGLSVPRAALRLYRQDRQRMSLLTYGAIVRDCAEAVAR